ncbi:Bug family tripartite tricarboxylate transporter substrate binding protein [Falsiroseomonas sp. HW251]|uniref:Bug family tripartite tricarboxylate transporter substrate binding protein n=1 Tax=Falsiroseomonas sp. HW251 TaxID=3390998 RepID=UPI003D31676B
MTAYTFRRRGILATVATLAAPRLGRGDGAFPQRPITLIVPAAPGGTNDTTARLLATPLAAALGRPVVIENRSGASGNLAMQQVARARPDAHTLLMSYSGYHVTNPFVFANPGWDPVRDFAPVALAVRAPHVILARSGLPASLQDLLAEARRARRPLTYGSSGVGSIQHIGGALLAERTGLELVHVPYRGAAPALNDLVAGSIDLLITSVPPAVAQIAGGRVRALALAAEDRHPALPDVPTTGEAGRPGYHLEAWFAVFGTAGSPPEALARLGSDLRRIIVEAEFARRIEEQGAFARYAAADDLASVLRADLAFWEPVIRTAGIRAE